MKNAILLLLLFNAFTSFGQNFSVNSELLNSGKINMDSIEVHISTYKDKMETESYFNKSKCKLKVVYSKIGKDNYQIKIKSRKTLKTTS